MAVKVTKPEINIREKLALLDYTRLPADKMPAGSVINTSEIRTNQTQIGFSTTTFTDTGLEVSINRKSLSSELLIMMTLVAVRKTGDNPPAFQLLRDDGVYIRTHFGHFDNGTTAQHTGDASFVYLDRTVPPDLETVTYKLQARTANTGTTGYINVGNWGTSSLLILEIQK